MTDPLAVAAVSGVTGFISGWALKYVGPRSKLVFWSPHNFPFQLPGAAGQPAFNIQTNSVTVQNLGRRPATNVQVVHAARPDHFKLFPALAYIESATPAGEHVISIASLGYNEWVTIEVLSYRTVANLLYVRSDEGPAEFVQVMQQRVWPAWVNWVVAVLMVTGAAFLLYWALRGLRLLAKLLGIL